MPVLDIKPWLPSGQAGHSDPLGLKHSGTFSLYNFLKHNFLILWQLFCSVAFFRWPYIYYSSVEPRHDITNKVTGRPSKTQISLGICPVWSVFAIRMKKAWVLSYPLSTRWRLIRLGRCQADLSLHWAHSHFVGFVMSWLSWIASNYTDRQSGIHRDRLVGNLYSFVPNVNFLINVIYFGWRKSGWKLKTIHYCPQRLLDFRFFTSIYDHEIYQNQLFELL